MNFVAAVFSAAAAESAKNNYYINPYKIINSVLSFLS